MSKQDYTRLKGILRELGADVIRLAKHGEVYRLPNGQQMMLPGSPGDNRGILNAWAELRRKTGDRRLGR